MYNWIKVLHVLAIVSWMAGLLYLPRLFVYHAGVALGSETSELFKVMERRLNKAIMVPAMVVSWLTGLWLAYQGGFFREGWFHGKLLLVVAMSAAHGLLVARLKDFAADRNQKRHVYFRVWNEIPTLLMIGIVILVIVKPF
jgi:putative membrane protein